MPDSLSSWLALREPADMAARSVALTRTVVDVLPRGRPLRILDLATGTGSNVRYLARHLPADQQWLLVDRDPVLLAEAVERFQRVERKDREDRTDLNAVRAVPSIAVQVRQLELGPLDDSDICSARDLVTASALLDLVSPAWLDSLAARCRAAGAAALFALTYDGRFRCTPTEPEDETIRDLFNRHQRMNDKGFGRAAGPDAVDCAERSFTAAGYQVRRDASDWVLTPDMRELQWQLIEGWADAAGEIAPEQSTMIRDWRGRRLAHVEHNRSNVIVGHEDVGAWIGG